jgi:hypothetical protein
MNFARGHNDFLDLLRKHLKQGVYDIMAAGDSAPSVEDIKAFEEEVSVSLPDDFVSFSVSRLGGIYIQVKEQWWPPSKEYDIRPSWAFCSGLYVYGFSPGIPEFMSIRARAASFKQETGTTFIPCLSIISDADFYGFKKDGSLGRWNHEEDGIEDVGQSFLEVLDREIAELASRQQMMETEKHKFSPPSEGSD